MHQIWMRTFGYNLQTFGCDKEQWVHIQNPNEVEMGLITGFMSPKCENLSCHATLCTTRSPLVINFFGRPPLCFLSKEHIHTFLTLNLITTSNILDSIFGPEYK